MKNKEERKEALLDEDNDRLIKIYELGITNALWKSYILNKVNVLRDALGIAPRQKVLPNGSYDQDTINLLLQTDFSALGESYNERALLVLTIAPFGMVPDSVVEKDCAVCVIGSDSV